MGSTALQTCVIGDNNQLPFVCHALVFTSSPARLVKPPLKKVRYRTTAEGLAVRVTTVLVAVKEISRGKNTEEGIGQSNGARFCSLVRRVVSESVCTHRAYCAGPFCAVFCHLQTWIESSRKKMFGAASCFFVQLVRIPKQNWRG